MSTGTAGGSLAGKYPNPTIAANAVGSAQLQANAIPHDGTGSDGSTKLATDSVNWLEIGANAVRGLQFSEAGSATLDVPSVAANSCTLQFLTPTGVKTTDNLIVTPPDTLGDTSLSMTAMNGASEGFIRLQFCNPTNAAQDPVSGSYQYIAINP